MSLPYGDHENTDDERCAGGGLPARKITRTQYWLMSALVVALVVIPVFMVITGHLVRAVATQLAVLAILGVVDAVASLATRYQRGRRRSTALPSKLTVKD